VPLSDDLLRIAAAVSVHGEVTGVLAAEPASGKRLYLVAFGAAPIGEPEVGEWVVVDDSATPIVSREDVRDVASVIALCELAVDFAGGGDLPGLRARLAELRAVEDPAALDEAELDEAEAAVLALEQAIGEEPRVASPAYLDEVGYAARELERVLGETASPFAEALRSGTGAIEEFARDVERRYAVELR
jgi:hypothetical protein